MADLTQERLKELLHYDPETGLFTWKKWRPGGRAQAGCVAGCVNPLGYVQIYVDSKKYLAHRLAWFYMHGCWPNIIDHLNRIRDDNRINNLRSGTLFDNGQNKTTRVTNTSGRAGISKRGVKWVVRLAMNGRSVHVGLFDSFDEACEVRELAELAKTWFVCELKRIGLIV